MKRISQILALCLLAMGSNVSAQDAEDPYKDLLFMIIDGEYEKALSKAERITEKDKTRREPVPYIYASMAAYEISKSDELRDEYPRAFRDAIKYAYKAARYDDENIYLPTHSNYINELKADIMREARFHFQQQNWRKSTTFAKYVLRIDPDDLSALLLKGIAETKGRNSYQAEQTFEEADKALESFSASDVSMEAKDAYLHSVLAYAELMKEEGKKDKAEPFLEAVAGIFEEDPEFEQVYGGY